MEASVPENKNTLHLARALLYEFVGSAILECAFNFTMTSYMGRAFAYFVCWLMAVSVSGAHFNPALSLAVYLAEGKYVRQIGRLLLYWLVQLCGFFAGTFVVYMIFNSPINTYFLWPFVQSPDSRMWFFSELGNPYFAKVLVLEWFNTFLFVLIYLFVIYKPSLRSVDEIIKGLGVTLTLYSCYMLSAGSGACLNPAFAIAQTCYQVGILNGIDANGNGYATLLWVYIVFPLVGGIMAALWFRCHIYLDNKALQPANAPGVQQV